MSSNLRLARSNARAQRRGQALEVAEGLQRDQLEAQRIRDGAGVLRPAREVGEVVLEDLDPGEAGLRGCRELVGEGTRHADRRDRLLHRHPSRSSRAGDPAARLAATGRVA
jgi:hypothetical protein